MGRDTIFITSFNQMKSSVLFSVDRCNYDDLETQLFEICPWNLT